MTLGPDGTPHLYASDLQRFSACKHATHLDLRKARGESIEPEPDSADAKLLSQLGDEHEQAYLDALRDAGKSVVSIKRGPNAFEQTIAALRNGVDVVYQGALKGGNWQGYVDFLERIEKPSAFGAFSYEVVDTKLKRTPDPKHILQLVIYSDLLAEIQGKKPEYGHLQLGRGNRSTHRLAECADYVRQLRDRLVQFVEDPEDTRPRRCSECVLCHWRTRCNDQWIDEDSLYMVAGIRGQQVVRLENTGIKTMADLAALKERDKVAKMAPKTLQSLRTQAQLQVARNQGGTPTTVLRSHVKGKGFDLLPAPAPGDLFYDIEGNPHYRENDEEQLEYLHGIWYRKKFKALWAHNHSEEQQALKDLFEFFQRQIEQFPDAHIYHYAPYELTALRRLTTKYSFGEDTLDGWQREKRFVDLYAVVRGGIFTSEKNYSLKSLEAFYMESRTGSVTTATGSIIAYNNWRLKRDAGDPTADEDLKELESYNRIDCESTEKLRDWLLSLRTNLVESAPAQLVGAQTQRSLERAQANEDFKDNVYDSSVSARLKKTLIDLGLFHYREMKPQAWLVYDASKKSTEELLEDTDCLAGLRAIGRVRPVQRSVERAYSFPPQFTKMTAERNACVALGNGDIKTVNIQEFDVKTRRMKLRIGKKSAGCLDRTLDLLPPMPLSTAVIENAIRSLVRNICAGKTPPAVKDLLDRNAPNLLDMSVLDDDERSSVVRMQQSVSGMQSTVLTVQGPPGTGKTFVSARAILSLVQQGYRVAVSSNSHEAIRNVLIGCADTVKHRKYTRMPTIVHKISSKASPRAHRNVKSVVKNDDLALFSASIVGGTAWLLCRPEMANKFDYLFVDEAGQVSLANLLGMTTCASNIVLIGDPCQLPQVIQASHPDPANLSCLEWMLGNDRLVKPGRGIFLGETWRMHPKLCKYISVQFYEGRLRANRATARQAIHAADLPEAGAYLVPVTHQEPRMQHCEEEGIAIRYIIKRLLKGTWTDRQGNTRSIDPTDIIVVAPFNAQVNMLRDILPNSIRVGTVDKFQGQEAAIALVSMTSTSAEDTPRGMDFLLSRERINVALSRAKALSLVFASQRLLASSCKTTHQIRLVNALCALDILELDF
ncbi:MAG: TM0106 family RecB-like putative nuclease [Bacteroidetes bacterium]|nr:TM0106 family RecB-like putative nuclease [Bacteroidota bacterium]